MKKFLALILASLMLVSLTSCGSLLRMLVPGNNDENQDGNRNDNVMNGTTNRNDDNYDDNDHSNDPQNKIDASKITDSSIFSDGKAWVRYGELTSEEHQTLYCINKDGEILFSIDTGNINSPTPFYNGLSFVPLVFDDKIVYCICDETGKITKPSDVGATAFLYDIYSTYGLYEELFADGYIFAEKTEASFSGSSTKAALLNTSLEIVKDYTEENFSLFEKYINTYYYNGYLYNKIDNTIFDLSNLEEIRDANAFITSFNPEYDSDMWDYDFNSSTYYDSLASSYTVTLDLSQYRETIAQMFHFKNGLAPLVFKSANKAFFTVIREDGSFCFEPVELSGHYNCSVKVYDGKFLVVSGVNGNINVLETFDTNGKIAEAEIEITGLVPYVSFNDDVIRITSTDMNCYYSLELEPLF